MIALGILASAQERGVSPEQVANAARYRAMIAETGRFLTFCGGAPTIGYRMRENPADRVALKIVRETDAGIVVTRQDRHAYEPGLCRGRLCRQRFGPEDRRPFRDLYRAGRRARGHHRCAARSRCATRTRSWRRCPAALTSSTARCGSTTCSIPWEHVFLLGPVARAGRALADLAPSLRLAVEGRVHPRPGVGAGPRDGARPARADDRLPAST